MAYRVTRDENRVSVGNYTADLRKGDVLKERKSGDPNRGTVPKEVADYLVEHDLLVKCDDKAEANPWYDSEDQELSGTATTTENVHGPVGKPHNMSTTPENDLVGTLPKQKAPKT